MDMSIEELRSLGQKIANDPDAIQNLDDEQSISLRKYLSPLGTPLSAKKAYVNMGIVNWKDIYFKKFHTTALVGYLYRTLEEYEPEDELNVEIKTYEAKREKLASQPEENTEVRNAQLDSLAKEHESRMKLIKSTSQAIVRKFLNRNFEYNPDKHLRAAHTENKADSDRKDKSEAIKATCALADKAPALEAKLESKPDNMYQYMRGHLLKTYQSAVESKNAVKSVISVILDPEISTEDKQGILFKQYGQLSTIVTDMKKVVDPIMAADTLSAWKVNPPIDVFHQFDRYITNHYEQLIEVVTSLYNEKSDVEYAVVLYDSFKTQEAAREYKIQHENEFRTEVLTIESGAVSLIGPFKQNRDRVDFYNKNTEIMKRMMDQMESDHKLGKDLMDKQMKQQKKKNIAEAGPDAPGLAGYQKVMNEVSALGGKKGLSKEEADKLAEAKKLAQELKEDYEVPDDAIQVDMFFPQVNADGTTSLAKTKFFTAAEAPLHMQDGCGLDDPYQPKRSDAASLDTAYRTKTIVSKTGEKREIRVPVSDEKSNKSEKK